MSSKIDTLFSDAVFHTLRTESETFKYLGVSRGRIVCLSDERPAEGSFRREIKLGGRHVFPALTDAHLHLMNTIVSAAGGVAVCEITKEGVKPDTVAGVRDKLMSCCSALSPKDILIGTSYIQSAIKEKRLPTRYELDEWCGGRAVMIYNIDGHSSAMSSEMIKRVGVFSEASDGVFGGLDHESIQGDVTNAIASSVGLGTLAKGTANFVNGCYSHGIARVCALDGSGDGKKDVLAKVFAYIARRIGVGVRMYMQYFDADNAKPFFKHMRRPRVGGCGEWETDGAVGSHSAAFKKPYKDTGEYAGCYRADGELLAAVKKADALGCQISCHAIGELAIDQIMSAYLALESKTRHRIEHFEFPSRDAVNKLKQNKDRLAITVQPGFSWIDKRYLKSYEQYLDSDIVASQVPLKELVEAGVCVCGSSDSPVQDFDPFLQLLGMADFYVEEQSLTNYEALCCYTKNPAVALGEQDDFGTLELGKLADFFTSERDFLDLSKDEISGYRVDELYLRGKKPRKMSGGAAEFVLSMLGPAKKI